MTVDKSAEPTLRQGEGCRQAALSSRRNVQSAAVRHALYPFQLEQTVKERRTELAGDMRATFAPIEAGTTQRPFRPAAQRGQIDPEPGEKALALGGDEADAVCQLQVASLAKRVGQRERQFAGKMIVAGAGGAQRFVARADRVMPFRAARCDCHERMDRLGDLRCRQPVVPVPPLLLHGDEFGAGELGEVAAGRLRSDAGVAGQFPGRQSLPAHERGQDVGTSCVPDQRPNLRYGVARSNVSHGPIVVPAGRTVTEKRFGRRRSIRVRFRATNPMHPSAWERRMTTGKPNLPRELLLLLALSTLWGASYTFIRIGVETIPPITLIAARTLIAGAILLVVILWRGLSVPREAATWRRFLFQACLNSVTPFTLIAWAQQTTDASLAAILNSATPIFAFLITALLTRHEAVTGRKLFGVGAGLIGICLIVGVQALGGLGRELSAQLAIVAATVCYAGAAIFGKGFKNLDPILPAAGSLVCGATLLVPVSLAVDRPWTLAPSVASTLALLALAAFSTALAFVIYFRLVQTLGSVGTTAQAYLRVPIGVAIGVVFLGESLSTMGVVGLLFVISGVAAMTIPAGGSISR